MYTKAYSLFSADQQLADELRKLGTSRVFKHGETLTGTGSYIRSIPIVLSGRIKVTQRDEEGRDRFLYHIMPGESCVTMFSGGLGGMSMVTTTADEESEVLLVPIEKARELAQQFPQFTDFIFMLYNKRFEDLLQQLQELTTQPMAVRLINLLRRHEYNKGGEIRITHQQLADELGSAREVISRTLKQLEKSGVVELGRNRIKLTGKNPDTV
ncbi:MAG: Crp/Fnr family transcriptional regulator [Bacteroidetes bacterium]|nr:Crp/Fnr family transcriptional regulator [Bacteroidota bacterium]